MLWRDFSCMQLRVLDVMSGSKEIVRYVTQRSARRFRFIRLPGLISGEACPVFRVQVFSGLPFTALLPRQFPSVTVTPGSSITDCHSPDGPARSQARQGHCHYIFVVESCYGGINVRRDRTLEEMGTIKRKSKHCKYEQ